MGLKIASLNLNSLRKHIDEIRMLLANYLFDVFAINESKIDSTIPDSEINIPGYKIIRKDRNTHGGGLVIYIGEIYIYALLTETIWYQKILK